MVYCLKKNFVKTVGRSAGWIYVGRHFGVARHILFIKKEGKSTILPRNCTHLHRLNNNNTTPVSHNGFILEVLCYVTLVSYRYSRGGAAPSARFGYGYG